MQIMRADNEIGLTDEDLEFLQDDINQAITDGNEKYGYGGNDKGNNNDQGKNNIKRKSADHQKECVIHHDKQVIAYKYSNRFKTDLHEAIILNGQPYFLIYSHKNDDIKIVKDIQDSSGTVKPPAPGEYPYEPYE